MISISFQRRLALAVLVFLSALTPGFAVTLLPQEQAIANDMINDPNQGRPALILDPTIEQVARARAKDMAVRNYFSHVNPDGVAANYLLEQAGYKLPAWWGNDPTANYVESIAAGSSSPSVIWTAWMNSPPHEVDLLGQNAFFATETHYGVGYYYDANSTYQYYWVVITAPPEPVEIMSPDPSAQVTSSSVAVKGLTDPTTNPASVQYCVVNASGTSAYQVASGVASWSGTVTGLVPGENVIQAESLDGSGNVISQTSCKVDYAVQGTLTVSLSGSGSVTSGFVGVTSQTVGQPVTIKATPAPGCIFTGWTGSITSSTATLTFTMQDGLSLQANFEPSPFLGIVGGYYGILTSGSGEQNGLVRLTVSSGGLFTGKIEYAGKTLSFEGRLDSNGAATITIRSAGGTPVTITVQADLTDGSGEITGSVSVGTDTFGFSVDQSTYSAKTNAAPQAGRYTLVLAPNTSTTGTTSAPQGSGYAAIVVGANGSATITGRLADGTPYSATGHVANDGTLAIYCVPSGAPAGSTLTGLLTFESTDSTDVDGTLAWTKAPAAGSDYYPAGFSTQLPAAGSLYIAPSRGNEPMAVAQGTETAGFGDGNLPEPLDVAVTLSQGDEATMVTPGLPDVTFKINPVSGTVTGSFVMPGGNVTRGFRGVVLQKQNAAFGYFRGLDQYGYFSLTQGS